MASTASRQSSPVAKSSAFHDGVHFGAVHEILFVAAISASQLLTQAGLGQVVVPLEIIGKSMGTSQPGQLSWFAAAYSLTVGTFVLPAGRLGDIYGHKRILLFAWAWFSLWSLIAGFSAYSRSLIMFDICRALQGIAPAGILVNAVAILGRTYLPGPRKNYAFAIFGACAPAGFVVGGLFSSLFAQLAWWPWAFWSHSLGCASMILVVYIIVPADATLEECKDMDPPKFDYLGTLLGVSGLVLFNFAFNQAPVVGWSTPYIYILLILSIALLCVFMFVEGRVASPLVPKNIWNRHVTFMLVCIVLGWSTFGIWNFYGIRFLIQFRHQTPLSVVADLAPVIPAGLCATLLTGFLLPRIGPSLVMVIALLAFCAGTILFATAPVHQTYWANVFVSYVVAPFGMDMSFPAASIVASNSVPRHQQGIAASLVNTFVNFSISLGLGFAGTIETQLNHGGRDILRGYRSAWYLGIGFSGLGIVFAIFISMLDRFSRSEPIQSAEVQEKAPVNASAGPEAESPER